jgi:hypothetical protein
LGVPSETIVSPEVYFVVGVLALEEVHELEDVGCGRHPFGGIGGVVVFLETKLDEAAVGDVLHVLIHVVGVEARGCRAGRGLC